MTEVREISPVWICTECKKLAGCGGKISITGHEYFYGCSHVKKQDVMDANR